jgi:(1->4)-alpha-D-glucan 1-alpha-D-glucosylmutase
MRIPVSTYRLQFHGQFTFDQAAGIMPYLHQLGITDIYASPIFKAKQGSQHGYDVVAPNQINLELGGIDQLLVLSQQLKDLNIGWIQDIVPNHMAFDSQNQTLIDLLENGPDSQYSDYFDINWNHFYQGIKGRVLAPFLGGFYGECLEKGELQLQYSENGLSINYYQLRLPIKIESYLTVLTLNLDELRRKLGRNHPDFIKLLGVLYALRYIPSGQEPTERYDQISFIKQVLWELWQNNQEIHDFIENNIKICNGQVGKPESFNLLDKLLSEQFFRLSFWKVGNEELNYRRFFTINDLICTRVEEAKVFAYTHDLILQLTAEQVFTGLRIDHIDGLYDPANYLERLREKAPDTYILVEKILELTEQLPNNWHSQGTTGYDFLNYVNGIFCQRQNVNKFNHLYGEILGYSPDYESLVQMKKRLIVSKHLAGDIDNLANLLKTIADRYRYASDFTLYGLKAALTEIMVLFPVYRTYVSKNGVSNADRQYIERAIALAKKNAPLFLNELNFVKKFLLLEFDEHLSETDINQWLYLTQRWQQFTGPLMAKGVEDTVMYHYNRLLALNEVGGDPAKFGISLEEFHEFNQSRLQNFPHSLNATATHDTKRGEDLRARLNVLSEIPELWQEYLYNWQNINDTHLTTVNDELAPDTNDQYFLYQTLIGAFPFGAIDEEFVNRIKEYMIKAIREAKVHTGWLEPALEYENACLNFIDKILAREPDNSFLSSFISVCQKIQHYGVFNSLAQTLIKMTAVGIPDFYQGTELWDLSLVDPDNRRPVDFPQRQIWLAEIAEGCHTDILGLMADLLNNYANGRVKLFLIYRCLQARNLYPEVFQRGEYIPLSPVGSLREHLVTFARQFQNNTVIAIAPRFFTSLIKEKELPLGENIWQETRVNLPANTLNCQWLDIISGRVIKAENTLWLREVLQNFPVALLVKQDCQESCEPAE